MAKHRPPRKIGLDEGARSLRERFGNRIAPPLEGLAYRFTIWLPVQSGGKPVFSLPQQALIFDLLISCCGDCSQSNLQGFPPWAGAWLPKGKERPIVDHHILMVAYTLQNEDALSCMRQLKWILQQDHVAAQEVVLIENTPVHLIEAEEVP